MVGKYNDFECHVPIEDPSFAILIFNLSSMLLFLVSITTVAASTLRAAFSDQLGLTESIHFDYADPSSTQVGITVNLNATNFQSECDSFGWHVHEKWVGSELGML